MNGEAPTAVQEAVPLDQRAKNEQMRLRALSKRIAGAAAALGPLTKATSFQDLKKLEAVIKKIELKIPGDQVMEAGLVPFMGAVNAFVADAGERLRRRLGRELEAACRERQIPFRVVSREEPVELRLDPLSCILDFDRGQARLAFARNEIATAAADASAILAAHDKVVRKLEGSFKPQVFFERCQRAWRAARAATGQDTDRVEILDFLPYLAIEMQGPKFKVDPALGNYKGYDRAQFAFDILRLRRERLLVQNGHRLNLGVATGTSATEKRRVIYFEDEQGQGEYKLTIFFSRVEGTTP